MFWFVFSFIILFIIFLIVLLFTTNHTTTGRHLDRLKKDLDTSNQKARERSKTERAKKVTTAVVEKVETAPEVVEIQEEVQPPETQEVPVPEVEEPVVIPAVEETIVLEEPEASPEEEMTLPPFIEEEFEEEPVETLSTEPVAPELVEEMPIVDTKKDEVEEPEPEAVVEVPYTYSAFDNTRTMDEFGLSAEEAAEFMVELIQQVEQEIPSLEAAVEAGDNKKIEDISHMIKGSATNLGTGGIADVLIDFNTYMKTEHDPAVIAAHMSNLRRALAELKTQFQ